MTPEVFLGERREGQGCQAPRVGRGCLSRNGEQSFWAPPPGAAGQSAGSLTRVAERSPGRGGCLRSRGQGRVADSRPLVGSTLVGVRSASPWAASPSPPSRPRWRSCRHWPREGARAPPTVPAPEGGGQWVRPSGPLLTRLPTAKPGPLRAPRSAGAGSSPPTPGGAGVAGPMSGDRWAGPGPRAWHPQPADEDGKEGAGPEGFLREAAPLAAARVGMWISAGRGWCGAWERRPVGSLVVRVHPTRGEVSISWTRQPRRPRPRPPPPPARKPLRQEPQEVGGRSHPLPWGRVEVRGE